ncbi:MDR family MFS transporter [Paraburkholderia sp. RAU6.4a]|uniref:MDR family MFS transporter n=1 Tax=Paraburkholderia sp. RAU6.4a TaxID=2991067 RepID=UPI003D1D7EBD
MLKSTHATRAPVVASVMMSMAMIAIEATIVSTAMPQIVAQLGGLEYYSWVFTAFLLTQTATTVIFGKLADLYGRKPTVLAGIAVFLIGSFLCGIAHSMPEMIAYRLIQGIGAGAIQPVAITIIGDLFPGHERGKVQGYLASVWAISAVLGPVLGGLIIRDLSWAWIFWINIPIGIVAALGFWLFLHEKKPAQRSTIDIRGAVLSTVAIASLMVCLTQVSTSQEPLAILTFILFLVGSVMFIRHERRVEDPMISFELWRRRPILAANLASMLASMTLIGLTSFLPMYVQGVLQRSPTVAGLALTMMLVGWPASATIAARIIHRVGIKPLFFTGSICLPLGASLFVALGPTSSPAIAAVGSLIMGFGMGNISLSSLILIQEIVSSSQRGSATASNIFSRNIGSTLGASLLGAVFNVALANESHPGKLVADKLRQALNVGDTPLAVDPSVHHTLQQALHFTFLAMALMSLLIVLVAAWMPPIKLERKPADIPAAELG